MTEAKAAGAVAQAVAVPAEAEVAARSGDESAGGESPPPAAADLSADWSGSSGYHLTAAFGLALALGALQVSCDLQC